VATAGSSGHGGSARDQPANHLPDDALVVALRQHGTPPPEGPAHGTRDAGTDRLHAARERARVLGLHQEMHVIPLERIRDHAEPLAPLRLAQRTFEIAHEAHGA
jgi:hypothetical protein